MKVILPVIEKEIVAEGFRNALFMCVYNSKLYCYFHEDCGPKKQKNIFTNLLSESLKKKCMLEMKGKFTLSQEGENFQIHFN